MKNSIYAAFVAIILTLGINHSVVAKDCDGDRAEKRIERLTEKLGLEPEQAEQVHSILESQREEVQAVKAATDQQLAEILTEEQISQLRQRHGHKKHREG